MKWASSILWIASSGSVSEGLKFVGLEKASFLSAAEAINRHFAINRSDVILNCLPLFHVAGLSALARAHLAGCEFVELKKWSVEGFVENCTVHKVTMTSLVPTQVFDLVSAAKPSPPYLRLAIVGGGAFREDHYLRARDLGWPVLPSYGMTEACGQVATAEQSSFEEKVYPRLKILKHMSAEVHDGTLRLASPALAKFILKLSPKYFSLELAAPSGWYQTEDEVEIKDGTLKFLGRKGEQVKILGELVPIPRVEELLTQLVGRSVCVLAVEEERRGSGLVAVVEKMDGYLELKKAFDQFASQAPKIWQIENWYAVERFPRSQLGKIQKPKLRELLKLK